MAMTASGLFQLAPALPYLLPALVWGILSRNFWAFLLAKRPRTRFFLLLPVLATLVSAIYAFLAAFALVPAELYRTPPPILRAAFIASNVVHVAAMAVARHLVLLVPLHEQPPRRRWLVANYGIAAVVAVLAMFPGLMWGASFDAKLENFFVLRQVYVAVMLALVVLQLARFVRRGAWRPGALEEIRAPDMVFLGLGVLGACGWVVMAIARAEGMYAPPPSWLRLFDTVFALSIAAPLAVRVLGEVVRGVLVVFVLAAATAGLAIGASSAAAWVDPRFHPVVLVASLVGLLVLVVPGQARLREAIDHAVFRRSRRRREALETFVRGLAPDLGTLDCCRRALGELRSVMRLRGAAIVLDDGRTVAEGVVGVAAIQRVWRRAAVPIPDAPVWGFAMRELPADVREALVAAEVVSIVPIRSPRRDWGHLFLSAGLLAAPFRDDDLETVASFGAQLALVLDGAELLARALEVERSLAHSEKLAAIGELAARVAHEIRNPVTAARSLAQQLAREPASPFAAEHELILAELERVERQVAALLRFSRRDEFRFEPVELGELVRETVDSFRTRLAGAGIGVDIELDGAVMVRADREKVRQVLVNLIENAMAALADVASERRLALAVGGVNGTATLRVSDTGSGVPPDALPHLFEPFFSLKEHGTGLGLAIAKRTVDAHGGRIAAESAPGRGMTLRIELPLARPAAT